MKNNQLLYILLGMTMPLSLIAQESDQICLEGMEDDNQGWALYIDQDLFADNIAIQKNDDRDYTMGIGYMFAGDRANCLFGYKQLSQGLQHITNFLGTGTPDGMTGINSFAGEVANTAFSPDDIDSRTPIYDDRPYANLLNFSVSKTESFGFSGQRNDFAISNKLTFGILGLDIGKAVQTKIHEWGDGIRPRGWGNQISEGGELTGMYTHKRHHLLFNSHGWDKPELSWFWEASAGYYTEASANVQLRYGRINSEYFTHNSNPLSTGNQFLRSSVSEGYFFLTIGTRLVGYNSLLQGQFRESEVEHDVSGINRLVVDSSAGYSFSHSFEKFDFKLTYVLSYRSSEIRTGLGDREHYFGGLHLQFNSR